MGPERRKALADHDPGARWPGSFPIFASRWHEANTVRLLAAVVGAVGAHGRVAPRRRALARPRLAGRWPGLAAAGFLLWTFVEYVLHRVVFHHRPGGSFGRKVHFLAHGIHHKDPWDPTRLVFPPLAGYAIALGAVRPDRPGPAAGGGDGRDGGLLVGYLCYDLGHFAWHHARCRRGPARFLKRYHLAHHFQDQDSRYGVSQPLWDLVFRSGRLRF